MTKTIRTKSAATQASKSTAPLRRRVSIGKTLTKATKILKPVAKKRGRPALKEVQNTQHDGNETEEVDEFDQLENDLLENTVMTESDELNGVMPVKKKPTAKVNAKTAKTRIDKLNKDKSTKQSAASDVKRNKSAMPIDNEVPLGKAKRGRPAAAKSKVEPVVQETQPDPMDLDELDETKEEDMLAIDETINPDVSRQADLQEPMPQPTKERDRQQFAEWRRSKLPQTMARESVPTVATRITSASEDAALRRKVGDLTTKLETSESRYQALRDVGIKQAEAKFDQLKKQSALSASTAKSLIQTLKSNLSDQDIQLKESKALKKQFAVQSAELILLQDEIKKLNDTLAEAQRTNRQLSATLAAKRVAASTVESVASTRAPGSAMKPGLVRMIGSQEAAEEAEKASLKEDMYGDLTGLLIRKVTRHDDEDVFDCIQTGRNGCKSWQSFRA